MLRKERPLIPEGNLLYDIKDNNGNIIKGCYFIKYLVPIKSSLGFILDYVEDTVKCFNKDGKEITGVDLSQFQIIKIYHENTGWDYTDFLFERHKQICSMVGYREFPFWRKVVKKKD